MAKQVGFTLIELVITMVLLAILAIATTDFLRTGSLIYRQSADRQVLLGEARFAIERLNRELHNSLPNSARLDPNGANVTDYCLSFVPTISAHTYIDIPVAPSSSASAAVVTSPSQPSIISTAEPAWLSTYILNSDEVLLASGGLVNAGCSSATGKVFCLANISEDASSGASTLGFSDSSNNATSVSFTTDSPSQRTFILGEPIRYCLENNRLLRFQPADSGTGVLMASKLENPNTVQPFQVVQPSLTRNGLVNLRLRFVENNEVVEFNHDIVILNQP
ncbi:MSHA biogenesis protein MshO [Agarivorans sp. Toyoura001]|uniref:PilW family protein n=1 Tax=Agarivorans sp. Toyoura001 TaxID=2283141 RepID=UPI0010D1B5DD|nr:prepilin-type N-terminal cleavage/methylation domain-containing protein [Agarivorans sp. Toyoura001]GDY26481.1 MSHA biogenesis protein MshO [Agarivorans sp. Toyoura001]